MVLSLPQSLRWSGLSQAARLPIPNTTPAGIHHPHKRPFNTPLQTHQCSTRCDEAFQEKIGRRKRKWVNTWNTRNTWNTWNIWSWSIKVSKYSTKVRTSLRIEIHKIIFFPRQINLFENMLNTKFIFRSIQKPEINPATFYTLSRSTWGTFPSHSFNKRFSKK